MSDGIYLRILGDFGPFSRMGKSIGYQVTIGKSSYLIDCGAPLFQQIGGHGLKEVKGLIITHCHDDHKRWFTDLALFHMYAVDITYKVFAFTSDDIHEELIRTSAAALDRSLSNDSKKIVDIPYEEYVNYQVIGPRAKYRIVLKDEGNGKTGLYIVDSNGNIVDPDTAKIVISDKTKRPRMLFKDPDYKEWVEPESFYPFSSNIFYEKEKNIYSDHEGFTIEAIKASVWHGIPAIGVRISTNEEKLVFSSDTVNNIHLWKELYTENIPQRLGMSKKEFDSASIIYGDINNYIERVWSEGRYIEALHAFKDAIVVHDVSIKAGAVHTEYNILKNTMLKKENTILTHSPDRITSEWALCDTEKHFKIKGKKFFEVVGNKLYPMNADVYHKEGGRYYVGYKNKTGNYGVYERDGFLALSKDKDSHSGKHLFNVDMYEDISGRYFPKIENKNAEYLKRHDGRIERIEFTEKGSKGVVVESRRDRLLKKKSKPR